jgi:hypothetical protein
MKGLALLLPVLVALEVGVQPALAWAWPVDGPVLRPFVLGDDPYAGGQHRGIDIGAPAATAVRAPASGTVSFAGTVPTGGKTITIRTAEGFAVTLQRLGSYSVTQGLEIREGDAVGAVGSAAEPYVYLSIRRADEPEGYVDPVPLLPSALPAPAPDDPAPEPDPLPAPANPGSKHHVHVAPTPVVVEQPNAEPAEGPQASRKASLSGHSAGARRPHSEDRLRAPAHPSIAHVPNGLEAAAALPAANVPLRDSVDGRDASRPGARPGWTGPVIAALLGLGVLCGCLARRRRELAHAVAANRPSAVLLQRAAAPAEDADGLGLGKKDHVVFHRDLEGVLLAEREALSDLDGNDDPAQIVDVADDPRLRRSPRRARTRALFRSVRPQPGSAFRSRRTSSNTSPRFAISNRHLRLQDRAESFV